MNQLIVLACLLIFLEKKLTCSDDEVLLLVLRNCKYDIKKSESKLDKLLKFRQMVISKLAGTDIKDFEACLDEMGDGTLSYRDAYRRFIMFTQTSGKEEECSSYQKFIKVKWPSCSEYQHYSISCDDLPGDIIQNALRKANETEESRAEGIKSLKEFMRKKKLTCSDDEVLLLVLRNCKYDIKKSESKLEKLLKIRQMVISKLAGINIKDFEGFVDEMIAGVLPYRDAYGRIIMFTRPIESVGNYETDFLLIYLLASILFFLSNPVTSLLGIIYIADAGCSSMHLWRLVAKLYRRFLPNVLSIPLKVGKVEVVNEHFLFRWCYNAVRSFIPRKIANRVSFLGEGYGNLCKRYHPDILPNEFGGNLGPLSDVLYRKELLDFVKKLKVEHAYMNH